VRKPTGPSPAARYARIAGAVLVAAGLVGLIFGGSLVGSSGWQDALHLVAGVLGLAAAASWARDYALSFGLLFSVLGVWGLIAGAGSEILGELPVTTAVIVWHLTLGLAGLGAGAATPAAGAASPSGPSGSARRRGRAGRSAGAGASPR
jgi:hypothetical protein